jgi:hypothetical protein
MYVDDGEGKLKILVMLETETGIGARNWQEG